MSSDADCDRDCESESKAYKRACIALTPASLKSAKVVSGRRAKQSSSSEAKQSERTVEHTHTKIHYIDVCVNANNNNKAFV